MVRVRSVCAKPGCGDPAQSNYCPPHQREYMRAWRAEHPAYMRDYMRGYFERHPEQADKARLRERARAAEMRAQRPPKPPKPSCSHCGRQALAGSTFCWDHHQTAQNIVNLEYLNCAHCGSLFVRNVNRQTKVFCSKRCSMLATQHDRSARRRVRAKAAYRERVISRRVFDRDGWLCHLCGGGIDPLVKNPDRLAATVDHVVPLSQGGEHSYANVRAAHRTCNTSKGDRAA